MTKSNEVVTVIFALLLLLGIVPEAFAIATPVAGSFAYDIYDLAVNSILKGPIGVVCGIGSICYGASCGIKQEVGASITSVLGGAALLKADTIVSSMGIIY